LSGDAGEDRRFQDFLALLMKAYKEKTPPHLVSLSPCKILRCMSVVFLLKICKEVETALKPWPHLIALFTEFLTMEDCIQADVVSSCT
jgi:hypothetical protein